MTDAFVKISGLIFLWALVLGLLFLAYSFAAMATQKLFERVRWDAYSRATRDIGNSLLCESYWFSEDKSASIALELMGKRWLTERGDVSSCREEWRKRLAVTEKETATE